MKFLSAALLLAIVASPEIRYFRYQRAIQIQPPQSGQACLAIDPAIFAHAAPQLADLRLYNGLTETPYVIRVSAGVEGSRVSNQPLNLGVRSGETVFDAEMPDAHYSDVELSISAQNFIATVTVSGSKAKTGGPETRLGSYTVFDLTGQKLGRSTVLHLPESDFPYLHFRIAGRLRPEQVKGIAVERLPAAKPRYQTVAETSLVTQKGHSTVVEFTVPAHVPIDLVEFDPGASPALFSRDVTISVAPVAEAHPTDQDQLPQTFSSAGNLLRVHKIQDGKRIDEEHLAVNSPREDFDSPSKWTVTIENGDDVPVTLRSVRLEMLERTLCFDAAANAGYTLYYGDPALDAPRYDYATLFAPQANPARAVAAAEQLNPAWQPRPDQRPFTEKHPALLWIALIAVILLLGAIALNTKKSAQP
jgi:hypothetical protein